jgi:hypothetical protein
MNCKPGRCRCPRRQENRRTGSHRDIGIEAKSRTAQSTRAPEARHCARHLPVHPSARASDLDASSKSAHCVHRSASLHRSDRSPPTLTAPSDDTSPFNKID